ncbi:Cytidine and deoxycytidylate deaminase zinc-binding region [Rhizoctonia solani]|uniref:Cytidine and deoxycytidylate deaminase zinc-binding region n=1 Tax=Rhizoctonia solani TaxID=456999 RepID=A0A8H7IB85_9AGAM|nr:Cytidine and deoxycytidylate deaminase zinc-binding region [Rhizoctonia solani]
MSEQIPREERVRYMRLALEEAAKCEPVPTAFCVGCVITVPTLGEGTISQKILSTGYSRELAGNTHAEANALAKAHALAGAEELRRSFGQGAEPSTLLRLADVYTTLEPCSVRLSGLAPCADALVAAGIRNCIIGVKEPADFVQCEGTKKLQDAGIGIIWLDDLESECLAMARRGHS